MKLIESRNEPREDLLCPSPWPPASVCVVFRGPGPDRFFFRFPTLCLKQGRKTATFLPAYASRSLDW